MSRTTNSRLERFRKTAKLHRVAVDDLIGLSAEEEIESIRVRLNHTVFSNAQKWMLPSWALRRLKSKAPVTEPDTITNDLRSDWVCLGSQGCRYMGLCDSVGLVSTGTDTGSIDVWFEQGGNVVFPPLAEDGSLQLELTSPDEPTFSVSYKTGSVIITRLVYHVTEDGREGLYNEIQVRNISLEETRVTFFVALRPISVLGLEPIESLELDSGNSRLYANGILAIELSTLPSSVTMTTGDNPNLPRDVVSAQGRMDTSFSTARGLATAVMRYDVRVKPAGTMALFFASPLQRVTKEQRKQQFAKTAANRDRAVAEWYDFCQNTLNAALPEPGLDPLVLRAKTLLASAALPTILGSESCVSSHSWSDKARIILALCRIGAGELAESIGGSIMGYLDSGSPSISDTEAAQFGWAMAQVYRYTHSTKFLRELQGRVRHWLEVVDRALPSGSPPTEETASSHVSVMPMPSSDIPVSGPSTEVPPPSSGDEAAWVSKLRAEMDQIAKLAESSEGTPPSAPEPVLVPQQSEAKSTATLADVTHLAWSLAAVEALSSVLEAAQEKQSLLDARSLEVRIRSQLESATAEVVKNKALLNELLGSSEGLSHATGFIGLLGLVGLRKLDLGLVSSVTGILREKHIKKRLLRSSGNSRWHSIGMALQLAQVYSLKKERDNVEPFLNAAIAYSTKYFAFPEWVDPDAKASGMGEGCSVMAAADLLLLASTMVADEDGQDLIILPGVPEEWFTSTTPLSVTGLRTRSGMVSIGVGTSANQHQIEVKMEYLPQELEVHVPSSRAMPMVKIYGGGVAGRFQNDVSPYVRVVPLADNVVVTFHR